jgi:aspartate/glutamate racemase
MIGFPGPEQHAIPWYLGSRYERGRSSSLDGSCPQSGERSAAGEAGPGECLTRCVISVGFLHTADVHVSTFTALLADTSPDAVDVHVVDTELLVDARLRGIDDGIRARLSDRLREVASHHPDVILCSCSTLSSTAERLAPKVDCPVVRIDRPMAERAVAMGGRIALVVAVESTLEPTRALFEECAAAIGGSTTLIDAPCLDAWELFERGNLSAYFDRLARHVRALAEDIDVAVLAQASMAPVADLLTDLTIPVLSSPRLAVIRAVELANAMRLD